MQGRSRGDANGFDDGVLHQKVKSIFPCHLIGASEAQRRKSGIPDYNPYLWDYSPLPFTILYLINPLFSLSYIFRIK
jgi:hypothetical protein